MHVFLEAFAHINHCLLTSGTRKEHAAWHTAHMCCNSWLQAALQSSLEKSLCNQETQNPTEDFADILYVLKSHCCLSLPDEVSAALHPWDYQKKCFSLMSSRKNIATSLMLFLCLAVPVSDHSLTKVQFQEKQLSKATNPILPRPPHPMHAEFTALSQRQLTILLEYSAPNIEDMAREVQAKNINLVPYLGYFTTLYHSKYTSSEFFRVVCENSFVVQH